MNNDRLQCLFNGVLRYGKSGLLLLLLTLLPVSAASADGMFRQGGTELALMGGGGTAFDKSYFIIGASAGYYVLDGLGVGLSYEHWSGDGPTITKYSPYAQYVFYQASTIKPYVGGYYRHTSVTGYNALESVGARGGVYIAESSNAYLGLGMAHETFLDCQQTIYASCSVTFFDLSFVFSF
jgi:hypothetical protein